MSTLSRIWRPAVRGKLSFTAGVRKSSGKRRGLVAVNSSNLKISQEVEIDKGYVVTVSHFPTLDFTTSAPWLW